MAEKVPLDKTQEFAKEEPEEVARTSASDISVYVRDTSKLEILDVFPDETPSDAIAASSVAGSELALNPEQLGQFIQSVDELKNTMGWKRIALWFGPVGIEIERGVKREIRIHKQRSK